MKAFFDTNILIYAQGVDRKADIARRLIGNGGEISVQVLNEFTSVCRRKLGYGWNAIEEAVADVLATFGEPIPLTLELHRRALDLAARHTLPYYDALILAAAIEANCEVLFSEDFQTGRRLGNLTIVNPLT